MNKYSRPRRDGGDRSRKSRGHVRPSGSGAGISPTEGERRFSDRGKPRHFCPNQAVQNVDGRERASRGRGFSGQVAGNLVIGRNSVRELLKHSPSRVRTLYLQQSVLSGEQSHSESSERAIPSLIREHAVAYEVKESAELTQLCGTESHQGVVAQVAPRQQLGLKELLEALSSQETGLLVLLDGVEDPHNFGSILRAAECFGAEAVVWSKNRGAPLTPTVTKVSAGASELVPLVEVSNLHDAIKKCRDAGWWIVGAEVNGEANSVFQYGFPSKSVLVLGAEGAGLRELTKKSVDQCVYIPMSGKLDSLNVGQAAAVFLAEMRRVLGATNKQ